MMMTSNTTQGTSTVQATVGGFTTAATPSFTVGGPSASGPITITTSIDKFMIFTTTGVAHTFTVPAGGLNCDILMIGGGGGSYYAGSGAGACIVAINQTLPAGSCVVNVGPGGGQLTNGYDSYIVVASAYRYLAKGGGACSDEYVASGVNGGSGGCGGGAGRNTSFRSGGAAETTNVVNGSTNIGPTTTTTYSVMGNAGSSTDITGDTRGSGGGIGEPGTIGGAGGNGRYDKTIDGTTYNFRNYFANGGNNFGVQDGTTGNYYIGGGGGTNSTGNGLGAGGDNPLANTGSGAKSGYSGASGIVIIRYRSGTSTTTYTHTPTSTTTLSTTLGTPSIELVRGTQGDSNTDYKIGNYGGDFIVKSSVSGVDTDYLKISSIGAITNPTGTASWNTGSDRRIKENIARASYDMCYDNIDKLELNRFNYIKGFNTVNRDITQLGFIAQEVYDIFPKAISTNGYYSDTLIIPDLLSIDVTQINYTLYGAVKKLMEINKDKEMRLKRLEGLLNIEDSGSSGNVVVDSSNVVVDSSNVVIDSSNIAIDTINLLDTSSNILIDTSNLLDTPNITIDTSNIAIDTSNLLDTSSNISIDTINLLDTPNITIDTSNILDTSNIIIDTSNILDTPNITIDTSNILDTSSNIAIDTSNLLDTPNITIDTSNLLDTSNITIDTSNLLDTSSNI